MKGERIDRKVPLGPIVRVLMIALAFAALSATALPAETGPADPAAAPAADSAPVEIDPSGDAPVSPPETFEPLVFGGPVGGYAIYRDLRSGPAAYIGLCFLGGNQLAIRLYEPATGNELLVMQTFYIKGDASGPAGDQGLSVEPGTIELLKGSFDSSPACKSLLPTVYGWLDLWLKSRSSFDDMPNYSVDGDGEYGFEYWIPVLQFASGGIPSGEDGIDAGRVVLATAGVASSGMDPAFFAFTGEPVPVPGPSVSLAAATARTVTLDGLEMNLDSNWECGEDSVWRIVRDSSQDAYCMVETLDIKELGSIDTFDLIRLFILYSGGTLLPDGLRIFVFNEYPCLFYRVFDAETGQVTVQYKIFIPRDESHLSVLSLGAFESVYEGNKDFFESILF